MSAFHIELVSPAAKLVSTSAYAVALPSVEGEMTVMVGHAPLVCALNAGIVRVYAENLTQVSAQYFVSGGFCDVSETGCTILAEDAQDKANMNAAELDAAITDLNNRLDGTTDEVVRHQLETQLAAVQTKRKFAV